MPPAQRKARLCVDMVTPTGGCVSNRLNLSTARWEEENLMTETKPTETLSSQTAPQTREKPQQTQEAKAKAGPQPVQHIKPGRKPSFAGERRRAQLRHPAGV